MCVVIILVILPKRWQVRRGGIAVHIIVMLATIQVLTTPRAFLPVPLATTTATTDTSAAALTSGVVRRAVATTPTTAPWATTTPAWAGTTTAARAAATLSVVFAINPKKIRLNCVNEGYFC